MAESQETLAYMAQVAQEAEERRPKIPGCVDYGLYLIYWKDHDQRFKFTLGLVGGSEGGVWMLTCSNWIANGPVPLKKMTDEIERMELIIGEKDRVA